VDADQRLFEKLCLEGFQAGLSWLTILKKREAFRRAFAGFDFEKVARFGRRQVGQLLQNAGIVRHRGKIESTVNNARRACELAERGGLAGGLLLALRAPSQLAPQATDPRRADEADGLAGVRRPWRGDLKRRGFSFVGPTTVYAFMQAMGLVDHLEGCCIRREVEAARRRFRRPG